MKGKVDSHRLGMMVGVYAALAHAAWSLLVALDLAQTFVDWSLGLHFFGVEVVVDVFDFATAATLVVVAGICGYVAGYVLGWLWNSFGKK